MIGTDSKATTDVVSHASSRGLKQVSKHTQADNDQELNINELISEYSDSKPPPKPTANPTVPQNGTKAPHILEEYIKPTGPLDQYS